MIHQKDFIKILQNLDLDSLDYQIFTKIEKIIQNEVFSIDRINDYSPSLIHLINLEIGVMEYFRAIRKYCLNFYDYYILDNDEINFCQKMDDALKIYYKIKNYIFNKCQEYHEQSIQLLKTIDLESDICGEIQDFEYNITSNKESIKDIIVNNNNEIEENNIDDKNE